MVRQRKGKVETDGINKSVLTSRYLVSEASAIVFYILFRRKQSPERKDSRITLKPTDSNRIHPDSSLLILNFTTGCRISLLCWPKENKFWAFFKILYQHCSRHFIKVLRLMRKILPIRRIRILIHSDKKMPFLQWRVEKIRKD